MDAILTPVYKGTRYLHHRCSECCGKIYFENWRRSFYVNKSDIRFCPVCGEQIIRISDVPIYEEEVDFSPMQPFFLLMKEFDRKKQWLWHCILTKEQQRKIEDLIPFAKENGYANEAMKYIYDVVGHKLHYTYKKKLLDEFGDKSNWDGE